MINTLLTRTLNSYFWRVHWRLNYIIGKLHL